MSGCNLQVSISALQPQVTPSGEARFPRSRLERVVGDAGRICDLHFAVVRQEGDTARSDQVPRGPNSSRDLRHNLAIIVIYKVHIRILSLNPPTT